MANTQSAGNNSKPWWLLGIIIILISMLSSAAIYFVLDSRATAIAEAAMEPNEPVPPRFVTVSPFTVNIQGGDYYEHRLLYTGLTIEVGDEKTQELLEQNMPQLRSRLLMLLSSKKATELTTSQGKQVLTKDILSLFDEPFVDNQPALAVTDVFYTDFIVQ